RRAGNFQGRGLSNPSSPGTGPLWRWTTMTRSSRTLLQSLFAPVLLLAAALAPAGNALALDRGGYSMEVLIGGTPVHEYAARGTSYVEALKNREYSVRLTNRTAGRIAVALSVDGLNS